MTRLHWNNNADAQEHMGSTMQLCFRNLGIERIIRSMRVTSQTHAYRVTCCMDAANASNNSSENHSLYKVKKNVPTLLPFLKSLYGSDSKLWFFGLEENGGIKSINCCEGFQQGCTMGMLMRVMPFHPFIQKLHDAYFRHWAMAELCSLQMMEICLLPSMRQDSWMYWIH